MMPTLQVVKSVVEFNLRIKNIPLTTTLFDAGATFPQIQQLQTRLFKTFGLSVEINSGDTLYTIHDKLNSPKAKRSVPVAAIIALLMFLTSCAPGNYTWYAERNTGIERYSYRTPGWPYEHGCSAYYSTRPIQSKTIHNLSRTRKHITQ
jgi:hypothetical protein